MIVFHYRPHLLALSQALRHSRPGSLPVAGISAVTNVLAAPLARLACPRPRDALGAGVSAHVGALGVELAR